MISSPPRQSREIIAAERLDNVLQLKSEYGEIAIAMSVPGIFHVRHAPVPLEPEIERPGIVCGDDFAEWSYRESEKEVIVSAGKFSMSVRKSTGSITCFYEDGKVLYRERAEESRIFEEFDVFRSVEQKGAEIAYIETPDGKKPVTADAPKVLVRRLYKTQLHLSVDGSEVLYGLGQGDRGVLNLRGTTQYLHQANMKIAVPVLLSSSCYGLMVNTYAPLLFAESGGKASFFCEGDTALDYYILLGGSFDDIVSGYRQVTGKASMLPKWAYGYIQSLERYETSDELIGTVAEYRKRGLGLDCIVLDWNSWEDGKWGQKTLDRERFPDPEALTDALHDRNARLMISIWPSFSETAEDYQELKEAGKILPLSNIYNAFDPEARDIYWQQTDRGLFQYGADAWWCDSSEPVTPEWSHEYEPSQHSVYDEYLSQSTQIMPYEQSNAYSLYHSAGIYEGQRASGSEKRVVNLTRNSYLGQQRYGAVSWSGDISASWRVLREQIVAGLQFCATGNPYWTLDIGAFFVKKGKNWFWNGDYQLGNQDLGYRELYTRWYQLGAFLPVFRSHGTDTQRELWHFGEEGTMFYDALVKANRLRYRLLPTIYAYAGAVWLRDFTILRMLAFDFPDDRKALLIEDQFMFGADLMVCPVTKPMYYSANSEKLESVPRVRTVYLPDGTNWMEFETRERYKGGREYTIPASIDTIPLFVREGSIVLTGGAQEHVEDRREEPLTVNIYSGADADFLYYDDAHDGYGYENGEYFTVEIRWMQETKTLSLSNAEGDYFDRIQSLSFRILLDGEEVEDIRYRGEALKVRCRL